MKLSFSAASIRDRSISAAGVAAISLAVLGGACIGTALFEPVELGGPSGFFGQLHPVIVHFPIALILVGFLLETVRLPWGRGRFLIALGALAGSVSAASGMLLAGSGGYDETLLFRHEVSGIALVVLASLVLLTGSPWRMPRVRGVLLWITAGLVLLTGHLGGSLTHGSGYLTRHLPGALQAWLGENSSDRGPLPKLEDPENTLIYSDLIRPVLNRHCSNCHSESKKKGGLRLDSLPALLRGGAQGPALIPGSAASSPVYQRMTLPPDDKDRMPPADRRPVPIGETELVRWWVELGARDDLRLGDMEAEKIPASIQTLLTRLGVPRNLHEARRRNIPAPDAAAVESLQAEGLPIRYLSQAKSLLQVDFSQTGRPLAVADLERLLTVAQQVIWLDLGNQDLPDEVFPLVARFPNLETLHLENTSVEDRHLSRLATLGALEYLNVYGTRIGNQGLEELVPLRRLRNLYVWQTRVTREGVERLSSRLPALQIHGPVPADG